MKQAFAVFLLAFGISTASYAAELQGVLVDKNSSYDLEPRVVPGPRIEGGMMAAYVRTRADALKPDAQKSGYGVFTYEQKFVPFDVEGNHKALQFLRSIKKEDDLRVKVTGEMKDGLFKVADIHLME